MKNVAFKVENTWERWTECFYFSFSVLGVGSSPDENVSQILVAQETHEPSDIQQGWALELDELQSESGPQDFPDE